MDGAQARKNARAEKAAKEAHQNAVNKAAKKAFRGSLVDLVAKGHQEANRIFRHGEKKSNELDKKGGMMVTSAGESNVVADMQEYTRAQYRLQQDVAVAVTTSRRNIHSMARDAQATAYSRMLAAVPSPTTSPSWMQGILGTLSAGASGYAAGTA